jgi:hypothetical protein
MQFYKTFKVNLPSGKEKNIVIKSHKNKNEYFFTDDKIWVRNFAKTNVKPSDINNFYSEEEIQMLLNNEVKNNEIQTLDLMSEIKDFKKVLIISDGYGFKDASTWLDQIPNDVKIIANYGACRFWNSKRLPNYMLVTNPFDDALVYLPEKIFPMLIASSRTNPNFLRRYANTIIKYFPTPDENYESHSSHNNPMRIDEYRNSIAASVSVAFKMNCEKLLIAYPVNAYEKQRPATEKIEENELYYYPQQKISCNIIDANLFWYKLGKPNANICYSGIKNSLKFANYIETNMIRNFYEYK